MPTTFQLLFVNGSYCPILFPFLSHVPIYIGAVVPASAIYERCQADEKFRNGQFVVTTKYTP